MSRTRLLCELLGDEPHALAGALEGWLGSRRFAAFAAEHLTKVRKKLRSAQDDDSARDLLLELDTAYRLVGDKRVSVTYEPTPAGSTRGPDFSVRFTDRLEVMVEVTRLRRPADGGAASSAGLDARRLAGVLALKLGQTVADRPNALVVGLHDEPPSDDGLSALLKEVRHDAETTDAQALLKRGFRHRGEYLRRLARLSMVIVKRAPDLGNDTAAGPGAPVPVASWSNPQARTPLPNDVRAALLTALRASGR